MAEQESKRTIDHEEIREWIEERGGRPSVVVQDGEMTELLRVDFDDSKETLEEISWEDFFEIFESSGLAFLYQEETSKGKKSRFNKFIAR